MNGKELYQWMKEKHTQLANSVIFVTGSVIGEETTTFLTKTGIGEGDTEATLTGQTLDGKNFKRTDSVRIVPPKGKKGK